MHSGLSAGYYYANGSYHHRASGYNGDLHYHDGLNHPHRPIMIDGTADSIGLVLSVIVLLGGSLSLVGLAFAFITYSLFSDSSDFGGTTLMNLLASLFLGQLLHVIGNGDPTLFDEEESCLTLAFIQHFMWLSKFFWLLALVKDVRHRLTKIQGICQVSSKKIQRTEVHRELSDNGAALITSSQNRSRTLLGAGYPFSIYWFSFFFWGTPLILTSAALLLQQSFYHRFIPEGFGGSSGHNSSRISSNTSHQEVHQEQDCWLLAGPTSLLIVPVLALTTFISVGIVQTMRLSRGARHLLLTDNQFGHTQRSLSFALKLLPLLLATLTAAVIGQLMLPSPSGSPAAGSKSGAELAWAVFHVAYSFNGLLVACLLTCDCQMVRDFANVGTYFRPLRHRNVHYGTGEIVSANDLNMLVFCKDESNVV